MFFILPSNFGAKKVRLGERRREDGEDAIRATRKERRANGGKRKRRTEDGSYERGTRRENRE